MKPHRPCAGELLCRGCAARILGVSADGFDRHVRGTLPSVRVGAVLRWARADLGRWIAAHREAPCGEQPGQSSISAESSGGRASPSAGIGTLWRRASEIEAELLNELRARGSQSSAAQVYRFRPGRTHRS